jgi:isocitrate/isopropylmalate dehydrogenase
MAMFLATGEMLAWLARKHSDVALERAATAVERGVARVLERGTPLTADLVGDVEGAPTSAVSAAVLAEVQESLLALH